MQWLTAPARSAPKRRSTEAAGSIPAVYVTCRARNSRNKSGKDRRIFWGRNRSKIYLLQLRINGAMNRNRAVLPTLRCIHPLLYTFQHSGGACLPLAVIACAPLRFRRPYSLPSRFRLNLRYPHLRTSSTSPCINPSLSPIHPSSKLRPEPSGRSPKGPTPSLSAPRLVSRPFRPQLRPQVARYGPCFIPELRPSLDRQLPAMVR